MCELEHVRVRVHSALHYVCECASAMHVAACLRARVSKRLGGQYTLTHVIWRCHCFEASQRLAHAHLLTPGCQIRLDRTLADPWMSD